LSKNEAENKIVGLLYDYICTAYVMYHRMRWMDDYEWLVG